MGYSFESVFWGIRYLPALPSSSRTHTLLIVWDCPCYPSSLGLSYYGWDQIHSLPISFWSPQNLVKNNSQIKIWWRSTPLFFFLLHASFVTFDADIWTEASDSSLSHSSEHGGQGTAFLNFTVWNVDYVVLHASFSASAFSFCLV